MKAVSGPHHIRNAAIGTVLTGVFGWGWFITTNVIAIKQQLADGGNKQIVAALQSPESPSSLRANLSTVIAQVQVAQAEGKNPVPAKVIPLSRAIGAVLASDSAPPEAWRAAGQLISYRSSTSGEANSVNSCVAGTGEQVYDGPVDPASSIAPGDTLRTTLRLANCTLVLDDPSLMESDAGRAIMKAFALTGYPPDRFRLALLLTNVRVVYSGGPIVADRIVCQGCTFDIKLNSAPPPQGRAVVETLLAANDFRDVTMKLS